MATKNEPIRSWSKVTAAPAVGKGADPESPGAIVIPSGRTALNTAATKLLESIALEQAIEDDAYHLEFYVDAKAGVVGAMPVAKATPESMPVRRDRKNLVVYLKGVFQQHPHIKGAGRRFCLVGEDVGPNGQRCLTITLKSALMPKQRRTRVTTATPAMEPASADE